MRSLQLCYRWERLFVWPVTSGWRKQIGKVLYLETRKMEQKGAKVLYPSFLYFNCLFQGSTNFFKIHLFHTQVRNITLETWILSYRAAQNISTKSAWIWILGWANNLCLFHKKKIFKMICIIFTFVFQYSFCSELHLH